MSLAPLLRLQRSFRPSVLAVAAPCLNGRRFSAAASPAGPLTGLKVLELASVLAGPSVGQFLAELGADVIKVENLRTNGDVTRGWLLKGESRDKACAYFSGANVGKRSIALDAGKPEGKELCQRLAAQSDVVVASYKPGDAEKLGVDAATLRQKTPSLIYAQITGYGLDDPRVGYDALIQAEAGFMFMNGQPGDAGVPTKMPVALIDLLAAHQLKEAILLSLFQRERTGVGAHVHCSLMHAAVSALANQATGYIINGNVPQRMGSDHPTIVPYGTVFEDKAGQPLVLAVGADAHFKKLCDLLECPELAEKYPKNADRTANRAVVLDTLRAKIAVVDRATLLGQLNEMRVPAGAIADMSTVFSTPQAQSLVVRAAAGSEKAGDALGLSQIAWRGDDAASSTPRSPPQYAAHTVEVLKDALGMDAAEIAALEADGVIKTA